MSGDNQSNEIFFPAILLAMQRARASRGKDPLIYDPYAEPLVRAIGNKHIINLLDHDNDLPDPLRHDIDDILHTVVVRTRFFDHYFLNATSQGIKQVVILASGLDSRAYRLSWPAKTTVYEIDTPTMIDLKTKTLEQLSVSPQVDIHTIKADLRNDWTTPLKNAGFDPSQPTVWSAEGIVIFLPAQSQDNLCNAVTALSQPGSYFAADFVTDMTIFDSPEARFRQHEAKQIGIQLNIAELLCRGPRNNLAEYLTSKNWNVSTQSVTELFTLNNFEYPHHVPPHFSTLTYCQAILH